MHSHLLTVVSALYQVTICICLKNIQTLLLFFVEELQSPCAGDRMEVLQKFTSLTLNREPCSRSSPHPTCHDPLESFRFPSSPLVILSSCGHKPSLFRCLLSYTMCNKILFSHEACGVNSIHTVIMKTLMSAKQ